MQELARTETRYLPLRSKSDGVNAITMRGNPLDRARQLLRYRHTWRSRGLNVRSPFMNRSNAVTM